jgi:hypothetical protein
VFSVSGTIGQADAGKMSGGNFTVEGGFWGIISVVQTTNAPLLSIFRTSTNTVLVSWPSPSTGYELQQNTNLGTTNWVNAGTTPTDDGRNKFIIVTPSAGKTFYRLKPQ